MGTPEVEGTSSSGVPEFRTFFWRVCAAHMITYFVVGLLALQLFDYERLYSETELRHLMRPTSTVWVAAGPAFQLVRGSLFAVVLWPFAELLLTRGWAVLWGLLVGLAVLGTAGPTPGSLEGVLFTTLPLSRHLIGLPEVLLQTGLFSWLLVAWCRRPARWMTIVSIVAVVLIVLMSLLGVLAALSA